MKKDTMDNNNSKQLGRKELREELLDNQFSFGLFSLSKYEKMSETNPKKAYFLLFGPVITAIIVLALVFYLFV